MEDAFFSYASPTPTNTEPYTVAYAPGKPTVASTSSRMLSLWPVPLFWSGPSDITLQQLHSRRHLSC